MVVAEVPYEVPSREAVWEGESQRNHLGHHAGILPVAVAAAVEVVAAAEAAAVAAAAEVPIHHEEVGELASGAVEAAAARDADFHEEFLVKTVTTS